MNLICVSIQYLHMCCKKYYQRNQCLITLTIETLNSVKALRVKTAMELLKISD